jgi:hydrogenase maturation protease
VQTAIPTSIIGLSTRFCIREDIVLDMANDISPGIQKTKKKILVLGIGNPILCDDGVGIHVARHLKSLIKDTNIIVDEAYTGGLCLVDILRGYTKSILIDAIKSPQDKNGTIKRLTLDDLPTTHSSNPHDMSLYTAIQLAEKMGDTLPQEIIIIGIAVNTPSCFGEELTPEINKSVPRAIRLVLDELGKTRV